MKKKLVPRNDRLTDPWISTYVDECMQGEGGSAGYAAAAWPAANTALVVPVVFPAAADIYALWTVSGAGIGTNYDIGLYDDGITLLTSKGSSPIGGGGWLGYSFSADIRVTPGKLYYPALVCDSNVTQFLQSTPTGGTGPQQNAGTFLMTSALPLPSVAANVTASGNANPLFIFGVRA